MENVYIQVPLVGKRDSVRTRRRSSNFAAQCRTEPARCPQQNRGPRITPSPSIRLSALISPEDLPFSYSITASHPVPRPSCCPALDRHRRFFSLNRGRPIEMRSAMQPPQISPSGPITTFKPPAMPFAYGGERNPILTSWSSQHPEVFQFARLPNPPHPFFPSTFFSFFPPPSISRCPALPARLRSVSAVSPAVCFFFIACCFCSCAFLGLITREPVCLR